MKIIHTADLHLGQIMYQYYDRVDEHRHFFNQLMGWCEEHRPDALVVSGDIYDIPQPSASAREFFNSTFVTFRQAFPHMAIVVTAGNHDSASRIKADSSVWHLSGVTVLGNAPSADPNQRREHWEDDYIVELPSGFIAAMPFMGNNRTELIGALTDRIGQRNTDGRPVVLMAHLAVDGCDPLGHDDVGTLRCVTTTDLGIGFDYAALGHIHRPQTLGHDIADESQPHSSYPAGAIRYSGSALHVSCDEAYPHSVSLVELDRRGGTVELTRLRIDELRHFYTLPATDKPAANSLTELFAAIDSLQSKGLRGYIRPRIDYGAPLPTDFVNSIYQYLEKTGNELQLNPKTIWENIPPKEENAERPIFEIADLQQMTDPLHFIAETRQQYPELDFEQLKADFEEIQNELRRQQESADNKRNAKKNASKNNESTPTL